MGIYKYVSASGALRYLNTWVLRITPSDQFNDPFEMRPSLSVDSAALLVQAPLMIQQELSKLVAKQIADQGWIANSDAIEPIADSLVAFFMKQLTDAEERNIVEFIRRASTEDHTAQLLEIRDRFEETYKASLSDIDRQLPAFALLAQEVMHTTLPKVMGVLCLCASKNHPLMWAHYADSHRGALLEFDESSTCFNRRRHESDDFGTLRRVWYADTRPALDITGNSTQDPFVVIALTKALDWAYEQELRLLWPLNLADRIVDGSDGPIHLINVPATALKSITIGCKASAEFTAEVIRLVVEARTIASIAVRKAAMDGTAFALSYHQLL